MRRPEIGLSTLLGAAAAALLLLAAGTAGAYETLQGHAIVESRNTASKTITLRGLEMNVTDRTDLRDRDGRQISLAEVPTPAPTRWAGLVATDSAGVWFEASYVRGKWLLEALRVVEEIPD